MAETPPIPARYAILLELLRDGPLRASELVEPTGLTVQGVSYHLKQLQAEGLVGFEGDERRARLTQQGVEALHEHFQGLKAFVDLALSEMLPVEQCTALAGQALEAGETVGLFMEDGRLVARRGQSPSQGTVRVGGREGDVVVVEGLTGLVDLTPGTVHVLPLPGPDRLPEPSAVAQRVDDLHWDLLALSGLEAEVLAERAGLVGERVRFAPARAARNAANVGLDVLLIASADTAEAALQTLKSSRGTTAGHPRVERLEL